MFFKTERDARDSRDVAAATAVARHVGWSTERALVLPLGISKLFNWVPDAELLLGPIGDATPSQGLVGSMRMARVDSLAIGIGGPHQLIGNVFGVVGLWGREAITWHVELRAWCASSGDLWVAPEAHRDNGEARAFRLTAARLEPSAAPWANSTERELGFARADRHLLSGVVR